MRVAPHVGRLHFAREFMEFNLELTIASGQW
jgi:hypothetical protein